MSWRRVRRFSHRCATGTANEREHEMLDDMDTTMFYRLAWRAGALACTGKTKCCFRVWALYNELYFHGLVHISFVLGV